MFLDQTRPSDLWDDIKQKLTKLPSAQEALASLWSNKEQLAPNANALAAYAKRQQEIENMRSTFSSGASDWR